MVELLFDTPVHETISRRLEVINAYYPLDELITRDTDPESVADYYRASDFFYNLIHSQGGWNIHMGLSPDGEYHKEDMLAQAQFAASLLKDGATQVLELGAGRGANTKYLAKQFPDIRFTALDLPNRKLRRNPMPRNVTRVEGDYNDLSAFEPMQFDLVLGVETVCHCKDKNRLFEQVSRVLKPGGKFLLFDIYEPKARAQMSEYEAYVSRVVLASMCVTEQDQTLADVLGYLRRNGFSHVEAEDLTDRIRPTLKRLDRISGGYFHRPKAVSVLRKLIREDATRNSIAGWLMCLTFDGEEIHRYARICAEKD